MGNKSELFEVDFKRLEEQVLKELAIDPILLSFNNTKTAGQVRCVTGRYSKIDTFKIIRGEV